MNAIELLEGLLGHDIASAFIVVANLNQMEISAENYTVGPSLHFSGKDAPTYDILTNSLPSDRRKCAEMLLDHMFPKRSVKLEDFPEIANLFNKEEKSMSMRVFYAYLFKENAEFKDIQEARQYINDLREKFIKWVPTDMIKWNTIMKLSRVEQMEKLQKDTQDPEIGGVWDYQLQCVMFAREVDGVNYIALQFFPSRPVVKFLKENVNLREFWYENQTDDGFDLPDWEQRDKFWHTVYNKYSISSQAGFVCDIYNGTEWNTTSSIMSELAVLADKQKEEKDKKE